MERWQRIMRVALERLDSQRLPSELDELFYTALRESLVAAGATDTEIHGVAQLLITWVVEGTPAGSSERLEQFELITDHLACTTVRVGLNQADTVLTIEFPDRLRRH